VLAAVSDALSVPPEPMGKGGRAPLTINVTPRVAQNDKGRRSAIDGRTTHHSGYAVSIRIRKSIEEAFGWAKTVAGLRKACHRGLPKIEWQFTFAMAAYNLIRLPKLLRPAA
jgi:hypothetical protein